MTPADLEVTHHFVDLKPLRLHYVSAGSGPLVFLLHGFPETWWAWRHQIAPLAEAGFRVIAPDLRGHGETEKTGPYDLDTVTGDVLRLLESLGAGHRMHLVGHDWGGALAWHLASHFPEAVDRLAILNCPHPAIMGERLLRRPDFDQLKRSGYMLFFQLPVLPERFLTRNDAEELIRVYKGNAFDSSRVDVEELRPFRDAIQRPGAAKAMVGWYRAALKDALSPPRARRPYGTIPNETLLIWGMNDPALRFDALVPGTERFATRLRVEKIEGSGHFVNAERFDAVNPLLLDFLGA